MTPPVPVVCESYLGDRTLSYGGVPWRMESRLKNTHYRPLSTEAPIHIQNETHEMTSSNEELSVTALLPPVTVLTAHWCHAHRGLLLEDEIELDRTVGRTEEAWERTRAAALEGRAADIPIARETLGAWKIEDVPDEAALEDRADLLPSALVAVEKVWGESRHDEVPDVALRAAFEVAAARRERILAEYRPPAPEVRSPWHEVHQGCARPDAMKRVRVLHLVDHALSRSRDRWALSCVELDHAAQFEAEGKYQIAREYLDAAVRLTWSYKNIDRREPAPVALADWLWRCGELDRARQLLSQLRGEPARELSRRIEDKAPEREALADAERVHRERNGVESWSALIFAHLAAGHGFLAERLAQELCAAHPDDPRSWETRARVLHANARFRSALDPAVKWSDLAPDLAPARSLVARAFARVGNIGRESAASIAAAAIELCESGQVLPPDELEELAEICCRSHIIDWARRADDLVWDSEAEREPDTGWLVAAALRRCHGPWAEDAPEWLARLAMRGAHALQRWGVERVDSLQHWCELIDRQMRAPAPWRHLETVLTPGARAIAREANDLTLRAGAHNVALHAARELGYSEESAMSALVALDTASEAVALPDCSSQWLTHRAAIEAAVGPALVIALRASELAQQAWTAVRNDRPNGASLIVRETFQDEKLAWVRWAENQAPLELEATDDPDRKRLGLLHELARYADHEVRRTEWSTRWDDLDRW